MPWDLVSSAYAEESVPVLAQYARDALRFAAPPTGTRVLDVACGPGTLAFVAAEAGHPVDAIDFSPQMIEKLVRRLHHHPAAVTAQVGDGQSLPFADATFGAAFSMFGLMFFPDRAAGFRELRRVLVPGAKAVVSSWQRLEANPVMAAMFAALREAMAKLMGPSAPKPGAQDNPLATRELCAQEMSAAFGDVQVHEVTHEQAAASASELWKGFERTMPSLVLMRNRLGEQAWPSISAAVEAAVVSAIGSARPAVKMPAWLSVGTAL
jgi:ubiquinone/menaquinone biosynthesis C-methylase UbiE